MSSSNVAALLPLWIMFLTHSCGLYFCARIGPSVFVFLIKMCLHVDSLSASSLPQQYRVKPLYCLSLSNSFILGGKKTRSPRPNFVSLQVAKPLMRNSNIHPHLIIKMMPYTHTNTFEHTSNNRYSRPRVPNSPHIYHRPCSVASGRCKIIYGFSADCGAVAKQAIYSEK